MLPEWTISACFSSVIDNTCLLNYFFFLILRHLIFKHSLNLEINASKKQQQNWYTTPLFILWQIELSKAWPLAGIQCLFVCIGQASEDTALFTTPWYTYKCNVIQQTEYWASVRQLINNSRPWGGPGSRVSVLSHLYVYRYGGLWKLTVGIYWYLQMEYI